MFSNIVSNSILEILIGAKSPRYLVPSPKNMPKNIHPKAISIWVPFYRKHGKVIREAGKYKNKYGSEVESKWAVALIILKIIV